MADGESSISRSKGAVLAKYSATGTSADLKKSAGKSNNTGDMLLPGGTLYADSGERSRRVDTDATARGDKTPSSPASSDEDEAITEAVKRREFEQLRNSVTQQSTKLDEFLNLFKEFTGQTDYCQSGDDSDSDSLAPLASGSGMLSPTGSKLTSLSHHYTAEEACSDPLGAELSAMIDKLCLTKLDAKVRAESLEKYQRPSDCANLIVPRVNPELWDAMGQRTRSRDIKLQSAQASLNKGIIAVAQLASALVKAPEVPQASQLPGLPNMAELLEFAVDSLALLGDANVELCYRRREFISEDVHQEYKALCAKTVPITKLLFGDEVATQMTNIQQTRKIGKKVGLAKSPYNYKAGHRYHPYSSNRQSSDRGHGQRPFFNKFSHFLGGNKGQYGKPHQPSYAQKRGGHKTRGK